MQHVLARFWTRITSLITCMLLSSLLNSEPPNDKYCVCSLLYSQHQAQCLTQSRHLIPMYYIELHWCILLLSLFWEREQAGEGQKEWERENPKQALHCPHRALCRAWSREHEVMIMRSRVRRLTNWATQMLRILMYILNHGFMSSTKNKKKMKKSSKFQLEFAKDYISTEGMQNK